MKNPPIYRKTSPADTPVLMLALPSETLPLTKVSDYANSILAQKLSQMPGVGLVSIGGQQNPAIRVQVNPAQLAAQGLDLEAVRTALATATIDQPKGTLYCANQAFALQTDARQTERSPSPKNFSSRFRTSTASAGSRACVMTAPDRGKTRNVSLPVGRRTRGSAVAAGDSRGSP